MGNTDRGGTPTQCSGMITISNCLPPLTTNTAPILSEQHTSNRFLQSQHLCLPDLAYCLLRSLIIMPHKYVRKSDKQLDRTNLDAAFMHRGCNQLQHQSSG